MHRKTHTKGSLIMEKEAFSYSYSAKESTEIQMIRKRYAAREDDKLLRLRRLDEKVQDAGMLESLCVGIISMLIFGFGMCLCLGVFGSGALHMAGGVLVGIVGTVGMVWAYPLYRKLQTRTKDKYTPEILQLIAELTGEKTEV